MVLAEPFTTAAPVIASYDYNDFADGTGMVEFLGAQTRQQTTKTYTLTKNDIYSNDISTISPAIKAANSKVLDLDFDLSPFNIPKGIIGTAILTMTTYATKNSNPMDYYLVARVRKWDGTTETEIATAQTETNSENSTNSYNTMTIKIDVPFTHFAQGDILRVTIEVWGNVTSGGSGTVSLFHDPQNRTSGTAQTTQLKANIPFKLNL